MDEAKQGDVQQGQGEAGEVPVEVVTPATFDVGQRVVVTLEGGAKRVGKVIEAGNPGAGGRYGVSLDSTDPGGPPEYAGAEASQLEHELVDADGTEG